MGGNWQEQYSSNHIIEKEVTKVIPVDTNEPFKIGLCFPQAETKAHENLSANVDRLLEVAVTWACILICIRIQRKPSWYMYL